MRVETVGGQRNVNFGARVNVDFRYQDMLKFGPLKNLRQQLEKSGTENVYELGKATFTNPNKTAGKHEVLLNGQKFDEVVQTPSDGTFGFMKNFLQKCCDKENTILPTVNSEISSKLEQVREFIKGVGLSVENVKNWL